MEEIDREDGRADEGGRVHEMPAPIVVSDEEWRACREWLTKQVGLENVR